MNFFVSINNGFQYLGSLDPAITMSVFIIVTSIDSVSPRHFSILEHVGSHLLCCVFSRLFSMLIVKKLVYLKKSSINMVLFFSVLDAK